MKANKSFRPQPKSQSFLRQQMSCPARNVLRLCHCWEALGPTTHHTPPVPVLPDRWTYTSLWASIDYMLHFNNWSCFPTRASNKTNKLLPAKWLIFDAPESSITVKVHYIMFLLLLMLSLFVCFWKSTYTYALMA